MRYVVCMTKQDFVGQEALEKNVDGDAREKMLL